MKRERFTENQILKILKKEAKVADLSKSFKVLKKEGELFKEDQITQHFFNLILQKPKAE